MRSQGSEGKREDPCAGRAEGHLGWTRTAPPRPHEPRLTKGEGPCLSPGPRHSPCTQSASWAKCFCREWAGWSFLWQANRTALSKGRLWASNPRAVVASPPEHPDSWQLLKTRA